MGFEISYLKNMNLKDLAAIVDDNNDGQINNGKETSIFIQKAEDLLNMGMCTEQEFVDIAQYCPHDRYTVRGAKIKQGTKEMNSNQVNQQLYIKELNDEIDKMLSEKGLTKNETNIELIQKIIKQKKEIALEIRIHEKKLNELKVKNPKTQFEEREHIITYCCTSGGMLGGIVIGAKVGLAIGGIYGATIGGIIGGCIGIFSGHLGGQALNKATLSEDDIKNAQQEIQNEINTEQDIINELKTKLQNL